MKAQIKLSPSNADYARRIAALGSLYRRARRVRAIERAIADDLERRERHNQSCSPLNRSVALGGALQWQN